jgi:plastocyanin domain-containing protein
VATAAAGPTPSGTPPTGGAAVAAARDGYQEVVFALAPRAYRKIVVAAGVPVKWTIRAAAKDINGCNNAIVVPAYDLVKDLVPGDNVIEFLPDRPGTIQYSCWMGMIRSTIEVVAPDDPRLGPAS